MNEVKQSRRPFQSRLPSLRQGGEMARLAATVGGDAAFEGVSVTTPQTMVVAPGLTPDEQQKLQAQAIQAVMGTVV